MIIAGMGCAPKPLWQVAVSPTMKSHRIPYHIGETQVNIMYFEGQNMGPLFVNVHENETASIRSALRYIENQGGSLLFIHHKGTRRIHYRVGGRRYDVDPNRIFTDEGRWRTLSDGRRADEKGSLAIAKFARDFVTLLSSQTNELVLTVHNNTPGGYGLQSYLPDSIYASDAAQVYHVENIDSDYFFFTTDSMWYDAFQKVGWNAVLQDNRAVTDDGSLSVLCRDWDIPYVNVEARQNEDSIQYYMYEILDSIRPTLMKYE